MSIRTLVTAVTLVLALFLSTVGTAFARVEAGRGEAPAGQAGKGPGGGGAKGPPAPKPAKPKGPGPIYPVDDFGPRADDNVVLRWNEQALAIIRTTAISPPVVARALCELQTSVYDAWAAYDTTAVGTRLGGRLRRPAAEHTLEFKSKAISHAAYRTLLDLFPDRGGDLAALMTEMGYDPNDTSTMGYDPNDTSTDTTTPQGIGNTVAAANIAYRHRDGANQLGDEAGSDGTAYSDYTGYQPATPDAPGYVSRWQPLPGQTFLTPHWPKVKPFALTSADQFPVRGPKLGRNGEYAKPIDELLKESAGLDDRKKSIADFWRDGPRTETPPGHWNVLAQAVSRKLSGGQDPEARLDDDARMFLALDGAMLDASIAAWDTKVRYDLGRPISMVRYWKRDKKVRAWAGPYQGTKEILGQDWLPYQPADSLTPPFSEYVSGHSTFSAAAASVLRSYQQFKRAGNPDAMNLSVTIKANTGKVEPNTVPANDLTLSWATFTAAADEAGMSRRYGGIHFEEGDVHGRDLGHKVGQNAATKAIRYFTGSA